MQDRRIAWKEAARVFLLSRALLLVITLLTVLSVEFLQGQNAGIHALYQSMPSSHDPAGANIFLFSWYHWDAVHFVSISGRGYADRANTAFFPLWPLLQHSVGLVLGGAYPGSFYFGGLLLSNLCFYMALVLLYQLIAVDFDASTARRALFYLSFAPYALFFFAGYTEALFLLLCVATFLVLRRGETRDWWFAGILGFLAALTRSSGVALAIPYLMFYIQRFWVPSSQPQFSWREKLNALAPIALIPAGVIAYLIYLYFAKSDPFIFGAAEKYYWHRHFTPPWITLYLIWRAFFAATSRVHLWGESVALVFTLIPLLMLGFGWKRIPLRYALFSLALAALSLSFPIESDSPLLSQPRYLLVLFPVAVIAALWGKNPRFHHAYLALSTGCFLTFAILFVCGLWVA